MNSMNSMNIAFPEPTAVRPLRRPHELRKLLAIVYLFAGISGFLALASKFVVEPLFQQLTFDRQEYINRAHLLLRALNSKLSNMVSSLPSIALPGEKKTCEAQTQTIDLDDLGNDSTAINPSEDVVKSSKLNSTLNELVLELSSDQISTLESQVEDVSSYLNTLAFQTHSLTTSGSGADKSVISLLKKDIRSIKGTLLSI